MRIILFHRPKTNGNVFHWWATTDGLRECCEQVEFPPIAQMNKMSDGSKSSEAMVRRANVAFVAKVVQALSKSASTVWIRAQSTTTPLEPPHCTLPSPRHEPSCLRPSIPPACSVRGQLDKGGDGQGRAA